MAHIFHMVWSEQSASCFVWIKCDIVMFSYLVSYLVHRQYLPIEY